MKTIIYVDGLNFYYGATKKTHYKWVDLMALSQRILQPNHQITKIKLFSAIVKPTSKDKTVHIRQQAYFQALQSHIPELEIYYGHFSEHFVNMPLVNPIKTVTGETLRFVDVIKREEKGSDVNLAVHFLNDGLSNQYDCGVIISNDSDIAEAVKLVRMQTNKCIGIISPFKSISKELSKYSHFQRTIRSSLLAKSQMPDQIPGTNISKPPEWYTN